MTKRLALTLDLDGLAEYGRLHGVGLESVDPDCMYDRPLGRFVELCRELGGRGTVFAIGRDAHGDNSRRLQQLVADGFEIASHSATHDYRLSLRPAAQIREDVQRSRDVLADQLGVAPLGFRAPGHHLSPALLDALEAAGFGYDSSVFPSPAYHALKAVVLAGYRLSGRASNAISGSTGMWLAPREPYRPGRDPYRRGQRCLLELPISVAGATRWPATGAVLCLAPRALRQLLVIGLTRQPTLVVNLHAMDLLEAQAVPPALAARQPELRIPVDARLARLRAALQRLAQDREIMTCAGLGARLEL